VPIFAAMIRDHRLRLEPTGRACDRLRDTGTPRYAQHQGCWALGRYLSALHPRCCGFLADGHRCGCGILLIGLVGFAGASGLGGLATNAGTLFAARGLQGVFGALLAPAALSLITVTFTDVKDRAKAFGVFGAISGVGAAIGLLLGGVLTEYTTWRWCLLVNIPIALAAFALALPIVRESRAEGNTKYDVPGAVLATGGLVALVYGFTKAAEDGWGTGVTLFFFALAAVLLVGFVVFESRTANPLLPLRVVLHRNRGGSFLVSVVMGAGMLGMFLFMTYYFQSTLQYSPLESGVAYLPFSGALIVTAVLASSLLPRVGPRAMMTTGGSDGRRRHDLAHPARDRLALPDVHPSRLRDHGGRDGAGVRPARQHLGPTTRTAPRRSWTAHGGRPGLGTRPADPALWAARHRKDDRAPYPCPAVAGLVPVRLHTRPRDAVRQPRVPHGGGTRPGRRLLMSGPATPEVADAAPGGL
jgi:MFS family permease